MKTTNDLKKGDRVLLANGEQGGNLATCNDFKTWERLNFTGSSFKAWEGTIEDNEKGDIRLVDVEGMFRETGSVYSHDIIAYQDESGFWQPIQHTEKQLALRKEVKDILK